MLRGSWDEPRPLAANKPEIRNPKSEIQPLQRTDPSCSPPSHEPLPTFHCSMTRLATRFAWADVMVEGLSGLIEDAEAYNEARAGQKRAGQAFLAETIAGSLW